MQAPRMKPGETMEPCHAAEAGCRAPIGTRGTKGRCFACGEPVCDNCSKRVAWATSGTREVRVCDRCREMHPERARPSRASIRAGEEVVVVRVPGIFSPEGQLVARAGDVGVAVKWRSERRWLVQFGDVTLSVASQAIRPRWTK